MRWIDRGCPHHLVPVEIKLGNLTACCYPHTPSLLLTTDPSPQNFSSSISPCDHISVSPAHRIATAGHRVGTTDAARGGKPGWGRGERINGGCPIAGGISRSSHDSCDCLKTSDSVVFSGFCWVIFYYFKWKRASRALGFY